MIAQQLHQFAPAWLQHFAQHALLHHARWPIAYRRHLDLIAFGDARNDGAAEHLLDVLGIGQRRAESDPHIVGEVVTADRDGPRVNHHAFVVHDEVCGSCSDINQTDAQFALIGLQNGVRASQCLENCVINMNSGTVKRRDDILGRGGAGGHDMHADLKLASHQARGIAHPALAVDHELLWQQVQRFAVFRHVDAAGFFYRHADVLTADLARTRAQANAAMTIDAADVRSCDTDYCVLYRRLRYVLGLFHG